MRCPTAVQVNSAQSSFSVYVAPAVNPVRVYVNELFQRQVCQTACGAGLLTPLVLIEVEVSTNSLPVLKSVSATKFPAALPPALMAVTSVPGDGVAVGVGAGVFVGVGAGVFVGVGVGVGVPPDGCQISMALINGLSAVPWVKAITRCPMLLAP